VAGIQLAHAGRKASTEPPWRGGKTVKEDKKRWTPYAPSAIAFSEESQTPLQMQNEDLDKVIRDFASAAERSVRAGFEVIELHFAHGYLLHEFLSPFSNQRTDSFGGSLENRMRLPLMIVEKVRALLPEKIALFVRISATDWKEGGWDLPQSIELAKQLEKRDVDLIDCSSGGAIPGVKIPTGPGYQVPFAESIRKEAGLMTGAVGMITEAHQAEQILAEGKADAIFLARQLLRDPYWPLHAAKSLGVNIDWPVQYSLAKF
jgi:2,4-dienoyl-CoA reductase-like NADH-dependent reductase (Old Yellow Enzyme family)